ncbi:MAG: 4-(cytidine 5'-diphospho)-2-C-methyl-D-erythritol kinase [Acidiferrobacterales bacterium]|nr:4-(cytidine 5'-diphospho)-2-C-methyl-D-erythritol kinase [Acidiferrobacterales bacterium]
MKIWHAPAKLNLFLHVVGRLENGYHQLQTVYQLIDWKDELEFEVSPDGRIRRPSEVPGIAEEQCLTVKAACALRDRFPGTEGVDIRLKKNIPAGSGLGGGSSDAATTLIALNSLWKLDLSAAELAEVGADVGADVPVFIHGTNAWAQGIGEHLSGISLSEQLYLVVVPPVEVSTRRVFSQCDLSPYRDRISMQDFYDGAVCNDLEQTACRLYPEVRLALEWLGQHGEAKMTGSGGAVFAAVKSEEQAEELVRSRPSGYRCRFCVGMGS